MYSEIEDAMAQMDDYGSCEGTCDNCSHEMTVEPDGDYPCPECGKGRVQSPLFRAGMI